MFHFLQVTNAVGSVATHHEARKRVSKHMSVIHIFTFVRGIIQQPAFTFKGHWGRPLGTSPKSCAEMPLKEIHAGVRGDNIPEAVTV